MEPPKVLNKKTALPPRKGDRERVYIGRGSPYGNPYVIGPDGGRDEVCDKYEVVMNDIFEHAPTQKLLWIEALCGKDLVCFCKPLRCHGDFLLRLVNP